MILAYSLRDDAQLDLLVKVILPVFPPIKLHFLLSSWHIICEWVPKDFTGGTEEKKPPASVRGTGSNHHSGKSHGEGNGNPL